MADLAMALGIRREVNRGVGSAVGRSRRFRVDWRDARRHRLDRLSNRPGLAEIGVNPRYPQHRSSFTGRFCCEHAASTPTRNGFDPSLHGHWHSRSIWRTPSPSCFAVYVCVSRRSRTWAKISNRFRSLRLNARGALGPCRFRAKHDAQSPTL